MVEEMQKSDAPGYVETGDNTAHSIEHVGEVPIWKE